MEVNFSKKLQSIIKTQVTEYFTSVSDEEYIKFTKSMLFTNAVLIPIKNMRNYFNECQRIISRNDIIIYHIDLYGRIIESYNNKYYKMLNKYMRISIRIYATFKLLDKIDDYVLTCFDYSSLICNMSYEIYDVSRLHKFQEIPKIVDKHISVIYRYFRHKQY